MRTRELEALAEAVRTENYRKMVFDAQIEYVYWRLLSTSHLMIVTGTSQHLPILINSLPKAWNVIQMVWIGIELQKR